MRLTNAQIQEIDRLRREGRDSLLAERVVDFARTNTRSALHSHQAWQNWDVSKAAEAHWRDIARGMIQVVVTIIANPDSGAQMTVRALVTNPSIRSELGGSGYMGTERALRNRLHTRAEIAQAIGTARSLVLHYGSFHLIRPHWERALTGLEHELRDFDAETARLDDARRKRAPRKEAVTRRKTAPSRRKVAPPKRKAAPKRKRKGSGNE